MSVRATNWAWEKGRELDLSQGQRLTLLRTADHTDGDGVCWPGEKGIATYTGATDRTVREHLAALESLELLHRERQSAREVGRGRAPDRIVLHLDPPEETSGCSDDLPEISAGPTGNLKHDLPEDSRTGLYREPSVEPSENQQQTVDLVEDVYDFWKVQTNRNGSTRLTPGRRRAVQARLEEGYEIELIKRAIHNVARSPFHQGKNDRERRFDDLTMICRNGEKLEGYAEMRPKGDNESPAGARRGPDGPRPPIVESEKATEAWAGAKAHLEANLPRATFDLWVAPLEVAGARGESLVLVDGQQGGWTRRRYSGLITGAVKGFGYSSIEICTQIDLELQAA